LQLRRYQEAREALQIAADFFHFGGLPIQEGSARSALAMVFLQTGELSRAEREARRAVEAASHIQTTGALARACLAWVFLAQEQNEQARQEATLAYQMLERVGRLGEGDMLVRLAYIESHLLHNELVAVRQALSVARQELLYQASTIRHEEAQQRFLFENVESQRILSLARSWLEDI
jgi:hypothetical protein